MPNDDSTPARHPGNGLAPPADEQSSPSIQGIQGLAILVERLTAWLFDVGNWAFGGLIAFNVVVASALIAARPVDAAILVAAAALATAIPLNVVGIILLRLAKDVDELGMDQLTLQSFQEAGFPGIESFFPPPGERKHHRRRRTRMTLYFCSALGALGMALTLVGFGAALWHVAWWLGIVLLAAVVLGAILAVTAISISMPPESDAEKELKRRFRELKLQQRHRAGQPGERP